MKVARGCDGDKEGRRRAVGVCAEEREFATDLYL